MKFQWFNAREVTEAGTALASQIAPLVAAAQASRDKSAAEKADRTFAELLRRAKIEARSLRLNIYRRAKLAHSFKWGLLENGVPAAPADELTRLLLLHLSRKETDIASGRHLTRAARIPANAGDGEHFFVEGNEHFKRGAYDKAIAAYQELVEIRPDHAAGLANLGAAFCTVGRYKEASHYLSRALEVQPDNPDALSNLGVLLMSMGKIREAEDLLRRALKLERKHVDAQNNLGLALVLLGRSREARPRFQKVLKVAPRNADATYGIGQVARVEGRFDEAESMFNRALEIKPKIPGPLAAIAGIRKMQSSDRAWLERAETMAASGIAPLQEAELRFAL